MCNKMSDSNKKMDETKKRKKTRVVRYDLGVKWDQIKDKNVIHFTNYIGVYDNNFYCHQCKQTFESLTIVNSHLKTPGHQLKRPEKPDIGLINALNFRSLKFNLLVKNGIFINRKSTVKSLRFKCKMCKCTLVGRNEVFQHIDTPQHVESKEKVYQNCMKENISPNVDKKVSNSINACKIESKTDATVDKKFNTHDNMLTRKKMSGINAVVNTRSKNSVKMSAKNKATLTTNAVVDLKFNHCNKTRAKKKVSKKDATVDSKSNNFGTMPAEKNIFTSDTVTNEKFNNCNEISETKTMSRNNATYNIKSNNHVKMPGIKNTPNKNDALNGIKFNNGGDKMPSKNNMPLEKKEKTACKNNRRRVFSKKSQVQEEKVLCKICTIQVADLVRLHAHLASHYSARFTSVTHQSPARVAHQKPPEIILKTSPAEIGKKTDQSLPDEHDQVSSIASIEENLIKMIKVTEETEVEKSRAMQNKAHDIRRILADVDVDCKNQKTNIYQVNKHQLDDIRDSIYRTCIRENKQKYCLICRMIIDESKVDIFEHYRSRNHCIYLQMMRKDNQAFETFSYNSSDFILAEDFIVDVSDRHVFCQSCQCVIPNDTKCITMHMNMKNHILNCTFIKAKCGELYKLVKTLITRDWYCVQRYWCVPCRRKDHLEVAFTEHLQSKRHKQKCEKFLTFGKKLDFDYCPTCVTLFYGFSNTFSRHSECKMHKHHAKDRFFVISKLPEACKKLLLTTSSSNGVIEESMPKSHAMLDEQLVILDLESAVQNKFPLVKAHPFGSRVTNLSNATSDLDIFVDCEGEAYNQTKPTSKTLEYLKNVEQCLKDKNHIWSIARTILHCQVPIIRAYHKPTHIECDLSFGNGLSVENTKLLRQYVENFPICRQLILFMKQWFENCDFIKINGICSYALAWLVIYYLQHREILPTVAEAIARGDSVRIGNWESATVITAIEKPADSDNFVNLLRGFFTFYAHFDYHREVICPLMGATVEKLTFVEPKKLPLIMRRYYDYIQSTETPKYFRIDSPMCIQDPLELSTNITRAVKKFTLYRFQKFCFFSADLL